MEPMDEVEIIQGIKNIAKMTRAYHQSLRREGFSPREAIDLTKAYVAAMISAASSQHSDEPVDDDGEDK